MVNRGYFSNVSLNYMHSLLQASDFKHIYRDLARAREALKLAPFCFSAFDLYGIVLIHYLLHIDKLGFPTDYLRIKEEGIIPEGVLDIPRSVESGILFTGGIAWERQVLTRNTQVNQLIKGYCLRYGYQALRTVRAEAAAMLEGTRRYSWRITEPYSIDFGPKDALEVCSKLEGELNQTRDSLADIKTLSPYDMDATKLNFRAGMSNYSQAFKSLLDLIVRLRALAEHRKSLIVADDTYFKYFCKRNQDVFRDIEEEADKLEKLKDFCLLQDETCAVISNYLRSKVTEKGLPTGRLFSASGSSSPLARTFGFTTKLNDFERNVFVLVYPNDFLIYNHIGERGRVETFMEYLALGGVDDHILMDMPAELLCISSQFVTLSDEPAKPSKYTATPPSCYVTGNMYLRDSAHYFGTTLDKLVGAL